MALHEASLPRSRDAADASGNSEAAVFSSALSQQYTSRPSLSYKASSSSHGGNLRNTGSLAMSPRARRGSSVSGSLPYGSTTDNEQSDAYFSDLLSYSLERLSKEPELLKADQEQLKRQSQKASVTHYRAFIEVAKGLKATQESLKHADSQLGALLADLPALSAACEHFAQSTAVFTAKRAESKQLLKHHPVILELLEIPQLMSACVRSGSYDEALDLRAFAAKTALLHPNLEIVQRLLAEVEAASAAMLEGLLAKLRGPIQLPECLRVVGCLRRLAAFPEPELRRRFLQCREQWLAELVAELDDASVYEYLKRLTDVHRLQLFDVIMQFRAIFSDDAGPPQLQPRHGSAPAAPAPEIDGGAVYSWAEHRLVFYLETLKRQLPRIAEGGSLASVLEHCMYCGMSLGRVGLDFRGLLVPVFEQEVLRLFSTSVKTAAEMFVMVLDVHKWVPLPAIAARAKQSSSAAVPADGEEAGPPYSLLEHMPLAVFTNGLLLAFNELRHCALLSLSIPVAQIVQEALEGATKLMAHYRATRMLDDGDGAVFEAACSAMAGSVVPYIASCYARIFPGQQKLLSVARAVAALSPAPQSNGIDAAELKAQDRAGSTAASLT
ncbi:hypothetical protein CVIRNUC_008980 [Coccomyxa viridis]|uniref:Conserved oligomeric Golgi complex subunit 8 n=1 Tax=Coccomyxa viridis TaxID=1274662 RepID=A0AAV1IFA9_9CHLO|nr:hypothetical protein CVIRNUC_008980 [Coccomyxa viridis]